MLLLLLVSCGPEPVVDDLGFAPEIQLTTSPATAWVDEGQDATLKVAVLDDRDLPEQLSVIAWSSLDGTLGQIQLGADGRGELLMAALSQGVHELRVDVDDADGNTGIAVLPFAVNGLPTAPVVAFADSNPSSNEDLVAQVIEPGVDPEEGIVTYTARWFLDGEEQDLDGTSVPTERLSSGQDWSVELTSIDSYGSAGGVGGARVLIGNGAPTGVEVEVQPAEPTAGDALTCVVLTDAVDPDGDTVHYRFSWALDGVSWEGPVAASTHTADTVPNTWTDQDQAWTCQVIPTDYVSDGDPVEQTVLVGAHPAPLGELDPSGAWVRLTGQDAGDRLGTSLALGDLDGDGVRDLAIGAPGTDEDRGLVALLPGGLRGDLAAADLDTQVLGQVVGDELGSALHVADLDGDGFDDLLVGVPGETSEDGTETGSAWIFSGPLAGQLGRDQSSARLHGQANERLGLGGAVASLQTEEGVLLAVAAPSADGSRGALWLLPAAEASEDLDLAQDSTWQHGLGEVEGDGLSVQLTAVGDLDGDGLDDLALGLPGLDGSLETDPAAPTDVGAIYILDAQLPTEGTGLDADELASTRWLSDAQRRLGRSLSSAGDLDGDGLDDLLACAPSTSPDLDGDLPYQAGQALLLPGGTSGDGWADDAPTTWSGLHEGLDLCDSIAGDFDLDGDGHKDLAFASSFADLSSELINPGLTWIVYGPVEPGAFTTDDALARLEGPSDNALLGSALIGGELTGDGVDDLAIGARGWLHGDGETDYVGAAVVVAGGVR